MHNVRFIICVFVIIIYLFFSAVGRLTVTQEVVGSTLIIHICQCVKVQQLKYKDK